MRLTAGLPVPRVCRLNSSHPDPPLQPLPGGRAGPSRTSAFTLDIGSAAVSEKAGLAINTSMSAASWVKNIIDLPGDELLSGKILASFIPPSYSLVSVSDP